MINDSEKIIILGVMSGSSLDGLDLALCEFNETNGDTVWKLVDKHFVSFPEKLKKDLIKAPEGSAFDLAKLDYDLGYFIGNECKKFIAERSLHFIASHGHTIFHNPELGMTCQIGNGSAIAAASGFDTMSDFRSLDIALGGQGAPIVAAFEKMAFPGIDFFINLGGIANISLNTKEQMLAYDLCPCNQLLNHLAKLGGFDFDHDGQLSSKGKVSSELLKLLLDQPYFQLNPPKTLDNNFIRNSFIPFLDAFEISLEDKMRTVIEMIVLTIKKEIIKLKQNHNVGSKLMLSGGGAHNRFLVDELIRNLPGLEIILPENFVIDYKEAIMMAYLGYLRLKSIPNVLASVSGASRDSIGGAIYNK